MWRSLRWAFAAAAIAVAAFALGGAASSVSRLPDLQPWHHLVTALELRAAEIGSTATLDEYLQREDAVFREVRERVEAPVTAGADPVIPNRYVTGSRSHWSRLGKDWNRTQILDTPEPRGGALLVHGLTDSPYSMRALADRLNARGYYTLSLRMQGHGTVPGGLVGPEWEDWLAAVKLGARHVRSRVGEARPLVLVGYSNGGALLTKYALDAVEDGALPKPSRVVLVSPMIGVSPLARLARAISLLGPVVEKARWLDVYPEYNPFKYTSFPANAGLQTFRLTRAMREQITRLGDAGRLRELPPVLAFQSVVDTTVSTPAVVYDLFDRLPEGGGHELVLFDINRQAVIDAMTKPGAVLPRLLGDGPRAYAVTLVTNAGPGTAEVSAMTAAPNAPALAAESLAVRWPPEIFSLSHIALPFPPDDPVNGGEPPEGTETVRLGRLAPRGEKDVLIVPLDSLMRVSWNPFFGYLADRIDRAIDR
ncbi:MAG TPA: alpha/beta hydrolase [Vicinamibacterales bacterium]|nr:alpha/beta hydrolase [Vicinamibacterales bacterium]